MELSSLNAIRHVSLFQYKISVNVKLGYHFYSAKKDTMMPFKTTGANDNATIIGDVASGRQSEHHTRQAMKKQPIKISGAMPKRYSGKSCAPIEADSGLNQCKEPAEQSAGFWQKEFIQDGPEYSYDCDDL